MIFRLGSRMRLMKHLIFERQNQAGVLTINRPDALNALHSELLQELGEFLSNVSDINALILTGAGRAFVAGADVKEMRGFDGGSIAEFSRFGQNVVRKLEEVPFVTIAAVNGFALGGGLELALGCDFIYASEKAKFGLPEVKLGLIPGWGGTHRLSRAIGKRQAKELMMTGRTVTSQEAYELGFVNRVCPHDTLLEACQNLVSEILQYSPFALRQIKQVVDILEAGDELEAERFAECFATKEAQRDIEKFLVKSQA